MYMAVAKEKSLSISSERPFEWRQRINPGDTLVGLLGLFVGASHHVIVVSGLWLRSGLCALISICVDDTIHALMIH